MAKERDAMFNTPTDVALSTNDIEGYNLKTKKKIYVGSGTTELPEGYDWNLPKENSPITTSEPATANLSGLDEDILKTEDEMAKNEERYKNEQTRRDEELKRREDDIT